MLSFAIVRKKQTSRPFFNCAGKKISEGRRGVATSRSNNNARKQSGFLPTWFLHRRGGRGGGLLLVHYTSRGARDALRVYVCREQTRDAHAGQVSLKNRVAIPVSTWRKMKRAFHAPTLFSRFLVINSSASHYGAFPRERTQHKLQIPTAGV